MDEIIDEIRVQLARIRALTRCPTEQFEISCDKIDELVTKLEESEIMISDRF